MSTKNGLFIWVEGSDDERFFQRIFCPLFEQQYDYTKIIKYSGENPTWQNKFLKSIVSMNANYIFTADIDRARCISTKKDYIKAKVTNIEISNIVVVIQEIESWYLAGLDDDSCKSLGIKLKESSTNLITKEDFNRLIPSNFKASRIDFMIEILNLFKIDIAKQRNSSLKYFCDKYLQE
ncbi:hypothetical protein DSM106972_084820 [Dulcicalothrix desertica PCC 7102]|uniref:DUF4435 domain-containing protein n=1 Tax=Dulcicalothrix desertica PCC 7102 TaxID=232991 RepID=A0A433UU83_9CYAN|nr:hypothetical protein [Dulcicalothrix desertica]RUS97379.1 hypothetical protein DSM106972_084820 [Dulcicalothrix desertica PCC 7102]TWH55557.1 hypothetical protein CAL7102_03704 [Dulcicalothrix desertica PCC 7102]